MTGLGEEGLDLSFEDLEFIHEETDLNGEAQENEEEQDGAGPNQEGDEGEDGQATGSEEEGGEALQETEDNDAATEGDDPENVGGGSTEDDAEKQTSPQLYATLAQTLVEQGVLTSVDESSLKDIKDVDQFVDVMKAQIKAQELSDLSDTQREILTGMREGASEDTVTQFKTAMDKLEAIDDNLIKSNQQVQKDLIYQSYLAKGFSKEKAASYVDRSVKLNLLEEDAKEAHVELKSAVKARYDRSKQADIEEKAKEDEKALQEVESLKSTILTSPKIMNLDIPENTRKEVYEEMMKHVSVNPKTKEPENALMKYQRENPTEFSAKLYFLWKATKGFSDTSYFGNKKVTSSVKELERAIKQSTHVNAGGDPTFNDDYEANFLDIDDIVLPE